MVRIVVPYLPGGSAEAQARFLAAELQKQWGKPVIIENKPGAGTTIGAAFVATQKPDGHTLYLASTSHTVTPSLYKSLPYDPIKSFEQISMISSSPFLLAVKGDSEIKSLADLAQAGQIETRHLSWASSGVGAGPYLSGTLFKTKSGLDMVHVPFTGTPPSLNAVIGGHVNYVLCDITALPLIRSGQLKPLAVTTPKRTPLLPDVPTFAEAGFPGVEVSNWSSIIVPAGTPQDVAAFLNASIVKALRDARGQGELREARLRAAALDARGAHVVHEVGDAEICRRHQKRRHPAELRTMTHDAERKDEVRGLHDGGLRTTTSPDGGIPTSYVGRRLEHPALDRIRPASWSAASSTCCSWPTPSACRAPAIRNT